jgi:hypothetical protein
MPFANVFVHGQVKLQIQFQSTSKLNLQTQTYTVPDTSFITPIIKKEIQQLALQGFLLADANQVYQSDSLIIVHINTGKLFSWLMLQSEGIDEEAVTASGWRLQDFNGKVVQMQQINNRLQSMLLYYEKNGYPFAAFQFKDIVFFDSVVSAKLTCDKGPLINFDTVEVIGEANLKSWYIAKYLGVKQNGVYNEQVLKNADSRLSQLPFLQVQRSSTVYFLGNKAFPVFYLKNRKSSSIDGVIGFAPASTNNNSKLLITGELNARLQNLFGTGKSFDLSYRSFLTGSQELRTKLVWPYVFKSNVGLDYELNVLRFDTTFLDVKQDVGAQYSFLGSDYLRAFVQWQSTSLITVDTNSIKLNKRLPSSNDMRSELYGLGVRIIRYDYFLNPRKGFMIEANIAGGFKRILRNPTIDALNVFGNVGESVSLYDSITLRSVQYRGWFKGDVFIPFFTNVTWRIEVNAGMVRSQNIFLNELFRIGGIRTLKGFDEQAIFADTYGILNTELRYLLQQNSHALLFWNGAWYRNSVNNVAVSDKPFGFGAGLNFETGAGIFSLYYAVGKELNNTIDFNRAKIHFGFANYF